MTSDDVTALVTILVGAAASAAITTRLINPRPIPEPDTVVEIVRVAGPRPVVDFAIIRGPAELEIMVGPEGPSTGWLPPKAFEMRRAPSRDGRK